MLLLYFNFTKKHAAFCPNNNKMTHLMLLKSLNLKVLNLILLKKTHESNRIMKSKSSIESKLELTESLHP